MRKVCLEAVEIVPGEPPRRVASSWLVRPDLMGLLERLCVKEDGDLGAPPLGWVLSASYIYDSGGPVLQDPQAKAFTSKDPNASLCVEPGEVVAGLLWVAKASREDKPLDRSAIWNWLQLEGDFDATRFAETFEQDLQGWLRACRRASEVGGKVIIRVGA